jgi:hypothetical protein
MSGHRRKVRYAENPLRERGGFDGGSDCAAPTNKSIIRRVFMPKAYFENGPRRLKNIFALAHPDGKSGRCLTPVVKPQPPAGQ